MAKAFTVVSNNSLPHIVQNLIQQRSDAKKIKNFALSDQIRDQIAELGYIINDGAGGVVVSKIGDSTKHPAKNFLILFGSGEIAPTSVEIYRQAFLQFGKRDIKIVLVTTPAGFQPNVEMVYGEIRDFLLSALPDFNLTIELCLANTTTLANDPAIANQVKDADVIFLGPGSPTYSVKQLRSTLLLTNIIEQVKNGSTLILASAATISFSHHALPVYEIYKVGEDLHWIDGLSIYHEIWQDVTIIPHFNNREGGVGLDTSYCYVGKDRATKLLAMLPPATNVIGIDEHTALVIDLTTNDQAVKGKGTLTQVLE